MGGNHCVSGTAEQALERLKLGNARFVAGQARFPTVRRRVLADLGRGPAIPSSPSWAAATAACRPKCCSKQASASCSWCAWPGNVLGDAILGTLQYAAVRTAHAPVRGARPRGVRRGRSGAGQKFKGVRHASRIALLLEQILPRSTASIRPCRRRR
jgi:carbonic anhydrase